MHFDLIFQAIGAFGVVATLVMTGLTLRMGWKNHAKIQTLDVHLDGRLTELIETISKERFGAGMQQERIESRARSSDAVAGVAEAVATVATAAKDAAAAVIATAADAAGRKGT